MTRIPFSPDEMEVVGVHISTTERFGPLPQMIRTPITPKENFKNALKRDGSALWFPTMSDVLTVESRTNIDHIARAEIRDLGPVQPLEEKGGPDLFGVKWVFIPTVGGSMVQPGTPILEDVNDWKSVIRFPDVDALDWEGCKINAPLNETTRVLGVTFQNGFFERLISFMDFENAAMALVDEDQKDAVHELLDKLADMYIAMIDHYREILQIDSVTMHDDWGAQFAPFFSLNVCMEMLVPHIKKVSDHCHTNGIMFDHHSCGKNEKLVEAMIAAGDDIWMAQNINDVDSLRQKYGSQIMFGVMPPEHEPDATDEEIEELARDFVAKYAADFDEKPVVLMTFMASERMVTALYRQSRIALCGA